MKLSTSRLKEITREEIRESILESAPDWAPWMDDPSQAGAPESPFGDMTAEEWVDTYWTDGPEEAAQGASAGMASELDAIAKIAAANEQFRAKLLKRLLQQGSAKSGTSGISPRR